MPASIRMTAAQAKALRIPPGTVKTPVRGLQGQDEAHSEVVSKYRNKKTVVDGISFDSRAEARRFGELKMLEKAGEITRIELQPRYNLVCNGVKLGFYKADFRYMKTGELAFTIEDVKGIKTPIYNLKKRLMLALFGIKILETK